MKHLLKSYFNFLKRKNKIQIGFFTPSHSTYNRVMPSTRIRVYDIIDTFKNHSTYKLAIYNKFYKFDAVIFQKRFDKKSYQKAFALKEKGSKIILDINVNYYDKSAAKITTESYDNILKFTKLCDLIIVSSTYLKLYILTLFPEKKIVFIPENINFKYFERVKKKSLKKFAFLWSGYSEKALELLIIKDILVKLSKQFDFKIIVISEKRPNLKIGEIPIEYIKYNERKIRDFLLKGDVFISPRNLEDGYNKGHSFTKIGVAMALGIAVIASPVISYLNSPAIICKNENEWFTKLNDVLNHKIDLQEISKRGTEYCKQNYDIHVVKKKYEELFNSLFN